MHTVFYRSPLHIYRIEAMAAKPGQDAEHVGALQHERMLECDRQPTWLRVLFCRRDNKVLTGTGLRRRSLSKIIVLKTIVLLFLAPRDFADH